MTASCELAGSIIDLIEPGVHARLEKSAQRPIVIGLCGAQGSGKSTVSEGLKRRLRAAGLTVALLSIDDIYLTCEERQALGAVHPLLRTRGAPGTHDIELGLRTLDACASAQTCLLPRFSKRNDTRKPVSEWDRVEAPVDVVVFEGWCVGGMPQNEETLVNPVNDLERLEDPDGRWRRYVNDCLAGSYQQLFERIDWLVLLAAPSFDCIEGWRKEQEQNLRASLFATGVGLGVTLDDSGVRRFVQHFQRITQHILAEMPGRADITIRLDEHRRPVAWNAGTCDDC